MENTFTAVLKLLDRWQCVSVPVELTKPLEFIAGHFGFIAVNVNIGNTSWQTSLMPMGDGTHFIAVPAKVRSKENLSLGAEVEVSFEIRQK